MPVVLVLFFIALIITCVGIYLSSKTPSRQATKSYVAEPARKRVTGASSRSVQGERGTQAARGERGRQGERSTQVARGEQGARAEHARVRRVEDIENAGEVRPLKARANRTQTPIQAQSIKAPASRARANKSTSIALDGGFWGGWIGSWKALVPGLVAIFLLGFYLLNTTLPHSLLWVPTFFASANSQATAAPGKPTAVPNYTASQNLTRLDQLSSTQYRSNQEFHTWAYSACSSAAMTEVINSYGHKYRITDILAVEANIHEITPELGLLEESGIQHTGAQFGFKTSWGHKLSLDQVLAAANHGTPVIVSFPPSVYPNGHIVVVRGGNASTVYIADSSGLDWTQLTRARFLHYWQGFSAIMTPA
ncbi:MAG TPA: C39 family peptidase [Ktedonobacteraceae bacterium]